MTSRHLTSWRRAGLAVVAVVAGAATGLAAVAVHDTWWGWPLAVVTVLVVVAALPPTWWARPLFCVSWAVVVFLLAAPRPDGDYVVSANLRGYGLLGVAAMLVGVGVVSAVRGRSRADTGAVRASP